VTEAREVLILAHSLARIPTRRSKTFEAMSRMPSFSAPARCLNQGALSRTENAKVAGASERRKLAEATGDKQADGMDWTCM
jgi:hypothetical protein